MSGKPDIQGTSSEAVTAASIPDLPNTQQAVTSLLFGVDAPSEVLHQASADANVASADANEPFKRSDFSPPAAVGATSATGLGDFAQRVEADLLGHVQL